MVKVVVTMTITVPKWLRERMKAHPEIQWSTVCTKAIEEFINRLEGIE